MRSDLSARERVIVMLAAAKLPKDIAAEVGTTSDAVRQVGEPFGWPKRFASLKAAAEAIENCDDEGEYVGDLPAPPPPTVHVEHDGVPFDLDPLVDHQDQQEAAQEARRATGGWVEWVEDAAPIEDAAAVPEILDRAAPKPTDWATLVHPLARLVNADGVETVLVEAVVDVAVDPAGLLAFLDGGPHSPPIAWRVSRRITDDGRVAIEGLRDLLPTDASL